MLGRLLLIVLQAAAAWGLGPFVRQYVPVSGDLDLFVWAVVFALIVFIIGVIGSLFIKGVGGPSPTTLVTSAIVALLAAGFAVFGMDLVPQIPSGTIAKRGIVLAGAILGYMIRR